MRNRTINEKSKPNRILLYIGGICIIVVAAFNAFLIIAPSFVSNNELISEIEKFGYSNIAIQHKSLAGVLLNCYGAGVLQVDFKGNLHGQEVNLTACKDILPDDKTMSIRSK